MSNILNLLRSSNYIFSYNKDNKYYYINDNPITKKLTVDDVVEITTYINNIVKDNDPVSLSDTIKYVEILCKENTYSEKEAKKERIKAEKEAEKERQVNLVINMINDKIPGLSVDQNGRVRKNGEILGSKKIELTIHNFIKENNISKIAPLLTFNKIKTLIETIASEKKYIPKIEEEQTFDDIYQKIDDMQIKSNNDNVWLSYIDNGTNIIYAGALYLLFSDTYSGLLHYNKYDKMIYYGSIYNYESLLKIDDVLLSQMRVNFTIKFKRDMSRDNILTALNMIKPYVEYNPFEAHMCAIREKYEAVQGYRHNWDGIDRVHELFIRFFNCEDNNYYKLIPELMLCQCIKVNMAKTEEEHKTDFAYFIFGAQGSGKTEFLEKLFFWKFYSPANLKDKMQLSYSMVGKYLCFWDELKGLNNEPIESIKEWITLARLDQVRKYDAFESNLYKTWVDVGATNSEYWFDDYGYERRFICITIPKISAHRDETYWNNSGFDDHYIEQVWLQALNIYEEKYMNKRITLPSWAKKYNEQEQIKHNKIMNDLEAIEVMTNLCNFEFSSEEYKEDDKYIFRNQYNTLCSGNISNNSMSFCSKLKRIDDFMIRLLLKRKDDKLKLMMSKYFGWTINEYYDRYNKPRFYFTRED